MARILVIDDDASLLQMMNLMLKRAGHEPILAENGREGIDIARRDKPDMAIVDIMMPDLSGYEVCRILREDPNTKDIPLLILTALAQPEHRDQAEDSGADDFITKPVMRDDLVRHVHELLRTGARTVPAPLEHLKPAASDLPKPTPPPVSAEQQPAAQKPAAPAPAPTAPKPPVSPQPSPGFPLVAVMGLSGGVGTTTIAVNLGLGLMQFGRSCIVDLNNMAGQVAVQLKMAPAKTTWVDLINISPGEDKRRIGGALVMDRQIGVAIMAAPLKPVQQRLSEESLKYILSVLSEGFRRIVVDLPPSLEPMSTAVLRNAQHIVVVVGDTPPDLMTAPSALAALNELQLTGRQHIVINRTRPQGVSHQEVMQALSRPLAADIPYEPAQVEALTQGKPLLMSQPRSPFSQAILYLARQL